MTQEPIIPLIILGMRRSGTSCLAGSLESAGIYLGKVSHANKYNKKGNKENNQVIKLNDLILAHNNADWKKPPIKEISWTKQHEEQGIHIIQEYEKNCTGKYWGIKDPRILLTLPFWQKLLPNAKYIGTYRNPISVANSLNNRERISIEINLGITLWLIYNGKMMVFHQTHNFPLISFDFPEKIYINKTKDILSHFDLNHTQNHQFFDNSMRHQDSFDKENFSSHKKIRQILKYFNEVNL